MKQIEREIRRIFPWLQIVRLFGPRPAVYSKFIAFQIDRWTESFPRVPDQITLEAPKKRKDARCNTHVSWSGEVVLDPYRGNVHILSVWLRRRRSFRGWGTHDLSQLEDWVELDTARSQFRQGNYTACLQHLGNVSGTTKLTPAQLRMKMLAEHRKSHAT